MIKYKVFSIHIFVLRTSLFPMNYVEVWVAYDKSVTIIITIYYNIKILYWLLLMVIILLLMV